MKTMKHAPQARNPKKWVSQMGQLALAQDIMDRAKAHKDDEEVTQGMEALVAGAVRMVSRGTIFKQSTLMPLPQVG